MTWQMIAAIAGGIVLIGNAGAIIYKWIRPALQVKKDLEEMDRRTKSNHEALERIEASLNRIESVQRGLIVSEIAILNHMIDGNSKEQMKDTRDKIQAMLVEEN